jgi:hypothetical protein
MDNGADQTYVRDRRRRPTPAISPFLFRGRRRTPPSPDNSNYYVDRPRKEAWQSTVLLLCLSILDARLSLLLFTNERISEMNPLLLIGLHLGDLAFLGLKFLLTVVSLLILLLHWNFVIGRGRVRVIWLIRTMLIAYGLVVTYELLLLYHWT